MYSPNAGEEIVHISGAVRAVENLLRYAFNKKTLLEEALTHPSYTEAPSYGRLQFLGDSVLRNAVTYALFLAFPDLDPGQFSLLISANLSTERLARVSVRRGLHRYIRHAMNNEFDEVNKFALAVQEEDATAVHGAEVRAPNVLAEIVQSVAGAVYDDCNFDLQVFWTIFGNLLEPMV